MIQDNWLLDTSRDYFYFVTKFFEPINASATHIYYSALELSPASSIVRKLYYCRCNRITLLPRVVVGTPDLWDQRVSVSSKDCEHYQSCTWSQCGQFIAAQTRNVVEIRNQLTLGLFTTLRPTEPVHKLTGPLAYPPDGRSIACASDAGILIWDIQTGGVAKEIACGPNITSMVWSSDGRTIATTSDMLPLADPYVRSRVCTYDVVSGLGLGVGELLSCGTPYLWAHKTSIQVASMTFDPSYVTIEVFKIGSTLIRVHSFNITAPRIGFFPAIWSISPTTSRIFISTPRDLYILDYQNSKVLLEETGCFRSHCFSSDGSFFAASNEDMVHIWRYYHGCYILWETFMCRSLSIYPPHFSPTTPSILERIANTLQVCRLRGLPTSIVRPDNKYGGITPSGNYITTDKDKKTVTIISLHSQVPQFIDGKVQKQIQRIFITGNVLLVEGTEEIVAWLLTKEGRVDSVFDNERARRSDSIWDIRKHRRLVLSNFMVNAGSRVGAIGNCLGPGLLHVYHTETGEVLQSASPLHPIYSRPRNLLGELRGRDYDAIDIDWPISVGDWSTSWTTLQDGWVKDLEGSCRLWVPVEWRDSWDSVDWIRSVTTQFSIVERQPVVIKF